MTKGCNLKIEPANISQLNELLQIYDSARRFMASAGNPTQWEVGYPSAELLLRDIESGSHYVVRGEGGRIVATFFYRIGNDPTYDVIDGAWLNDGEYGVIHRLASGGECCGVSRAVFDWALQRCENLRVDTHDDNYPMRRALDENGFVYCGVIWCRDLSSRRAYHKVRR